MAATTAEDFTAAATSLPLEGVSHHLSDEVDTATQQQQEGGVVPQLLHDLQQQDAAAWQMAGGVVDSLNYAQTAAAAAENVLEDVGAAVQANGAVAVGLTPDAASVATHVAAAQQQQDEEEQQQQADEEDRTQQLSNSSDAGAATGGADVGADSAAGSSAADGGVAADEAGASLSPASDAETTKTEPLKDKEEKVLKFFVGGVYPQATELQIRSYFERYGKVKGVELKMDRVTGRNRGFAFVTMADESAKEAVFRGQHVLGGKKIEVRALHDDGYEALKRKIFVGGVNPSLSEEEIGAYFGKFGTVEKVSIIRDATTGKSRGFGFVVFAEESSVKEVLKNRRHSLNEKDSLLLSHPHVEPVQRVRGLSVNAAVLSRLLRVAVLPVAMVFPGQSQCAALRAGSSRTAAFDVACGWCAEVFHLVSSCSRLVAFVLMPRLLEAVLTAFVGQLEVKEDSAPHCSLGFGPLRLPVCRLPEDFIPPTTRSTLNLLRLLLPCFLQPVLFLLHALNRRLAAVRLQLQL
ncbi:UNVERIFIED_CONTAM: hypothetical protein H355_007800 [Colinus virginianus]|nr:hypothetical protein H355_007800 [Colinus virginianus]